MLCHSYRRLLIYKYSKISFFLSVCLSLSLSLYVYIYMHTNTHEGNSKSSKLDLDFRFVTHLSSKYRLHWH